MKYINKLLVFLFNINLNGKTDCFCNQIIYYTHIYICEYSILLDETIKEVDSIIFKFLWKLKNIVIWAISLYNKGISFRVNLDQRCKTDIWCLNYWAVKW